MAERITCNYLLARVIRLNEHQVFKASSRYAAGDRFEIDCAYGGYRLCLRHANTSMSDLSDLSNRGTARETADFITGVLTGIDLATE